MYLPFLDWFVFDCQDLPYGGPRRLQNSEWSMQELLRSLATLRRRIGGNIIGMTIHELLTSRGLVYRSTAPDPLRGLKGLKQLPVAQLPEREITHPDSWRAVHSITYERGSLVPEPWPDFACFPTVALEAEPGWTHFIVPLIGKTRNWISGFDALPHCGYFLNASIEFGGAVPDISAAWLAQSSSIISNLQSGYDESEPTNFYIPMETTLELSWELVLAAENTATTPESLAILSELPDELHVFAQVPVLDRARITEPGIYWSTDGSTVETRRIPRGALKINVRWNPHVAFNSWLPHHYEVARSALREHGFDPTSKADADALGVPLLEILDPEAFVGPGEEPEWTERYQMDPHTMQERWCKSAVIGGASVPTES
ncbi:hypothetical protein FB451DRAFT_49506 [Mycena latifolia]|nr:hypothetical protein FB451DRAFT_49506 [Mycena latifolia]